MPTCFVRILYYCYSKQNMKVKWGNCLSSPFSVSNGVRQGGVLSPYLFALYIDDLSVKLNCEAFHYNTTNFQNICNHKVPVFNTFLIY